MVLISWTRPVTRFVLTTPGPKLELVCSIYTRPKPYKKIHYESQADVVAAVGTTPEIVSTVGVGAIVVRPTTNDVFDGAAATGTTASRPGRVGAFVSTGAGAPLSTLVTDTVGGPPAALFIELTPAIVGPPAA